MKPAKNHPQPPAPSTGRSKPTVPKAGSPVTPPRAQGEVRIIGGQWKRSKLSVPAKPGLRPTPDRVRETLFNWLGQDLSGLRCIDAFAGSGALGFEAASRGAVQVQMFETDAQLVAQLRQHMARFKAEGMHVLASDALAGLRRAAPAAWDVVFLDPPFGDGTDDTLFVQSLQASVPLLAAQGVVYLEAPRAWTEADLAPLGLQVQRHGKAGMVHYHLLAAGPNASGDNPHP